MFFFAGLACRHKVSARGRRLCHFPQPTAASTTPGRTATQLPKTAATISAARSRLRPQAGLGEQYADVTIPAIPAVDLKMLEEEPTGWPALLQQPLVKDPRGPIIGFRSGVRSALLCLSGAGGRKEWYRLKGNGMPQGGFTIRTHQPAGIAHPCRDVRGSSHEHTTHRELYMNEEIAKALRARSAAAGAAATAAKDAVGATALGGSTAYSARAHARAGGEARTVPVRKRGARLVEV